MRPTAKSQDELRYPLNRLLGTESAVRILRSLCDLGVPVGSVEVAESSQLSEAGVRTALGRLVRTGLVIKEGRGRQQLYSLRVDPLSDAIRALFSQEERRYQEIEGRLKKVVLGLDHPPQIAWLGPPTQDGRIELRFVAKSQNVGPTRETLQSSVNDLEVEFDIVVDVRGFSRADEPDIDRGRVIIGEIGSIEGEHLTHEELDVRSEVRSKGLADLIQTRPDITTRAIRYLDRVLEEDHGMAASDLREWLLILRTYSQARLRAFLRSNSERAQRLRQSSPLLVVLEAEERYELDRPADTR